MSTAFDEVQFAGSALPGFQSSSKLSSPNQRRQSATVATNSATGGRGLESSTLGGSSLRFERLRAPHSSSNSVASSNAELPALSGAEEETLPPGTRGYDLGDQ
ncbi:unnamed protein product, partial [Amoebophrya sp. A25]|eukprot:GSA25T00009918001.1